MNGIYFRRAESLVGDRNTHRLRCCNFGTAVRAGPSALGCFVWRLCRIRDLTTGEVIGTIEFCWISRDSCSDTLHEIALKPFVL
jgi:hypothetical protein